MLFKVFHRTLEFNFLLSISLITASFLVFSISRTTLFLAELRGDLCKSGPEHFASEKSFPSNFAQ